MTRTSRADVVVDKTSGAVLKNRKNVDVHVIETKKLPKVTVHELHENIVKQLDIGARNLDRTTYLELLVRVADTTNDRSDAINEEIRKEHHEDLDG